jgi:2-dehydropantoate 2-reductase
MRNEKVDLTMLTKPRLLVFGAGVIGSLYALRFILSGMDVTMLARGTRLTELREHGLRYNEKGAIKKVSVHVIETLRDDDMYDFIFVPVRYDQVVSDLTAMKDNKSQHIVTLTNTVGYEKWINIVGNCLIPGFPGAGGDIKDGILHAQFGSKKVQGTLFGEVSNEKTVRIDQLVQIFEASNLPYEISSNILAFHISHAAMLAPNKHFYTADGMVDVKTAKSRRVLRNISWDIKENIQLMKHNGIPVLDTKTKVIGRLPTWLIILLFRMMLQTSRTRKPIAFRYGMKVSSNTEWKLNQRVMPLHVFEVFLF